MLGALASGSATGPMPARTPYVQAFEGLLRLHEQGLVRAVGTSNFTPAHLETLSGLDRGESAGADSDAFGH
jgi:diketogulonate reductase-like aldo/keto reductase